MELHILALNVLLVDLSEKKKNNRMGNEIYKKMSEKMRKKQARIPVIRGPVYLLHLATSQTRGER